MKFCHLKRATVNLSRRFFPTWMRTTVVSGILSLAVVHSAFSVPAQYPLFLGNPVIPIMMLNMSNDHQMYFKVYDDYADITDPSGGDPDGIPDTTYNHNYDYYGYFDSGKCYTYNTTNNRFEPQSLVDASRYCNTTGSNEWSGNFLNWATMTRIDAVRKILYGGFRSTDTGSVTVLERSYLPQDAHSFAKFYDGNDIDQLTPFTVPELQAAVPGTGITICNTTNGNTNFSQTTTSPPLIRVAEGNYTLWASNERWQCRWNSEGSNSNGNNSSNSGIYAYSGNPINSHKQGTGSAPGEYIARVSVCVTGLEEENCTRYPNGNYKPTGLLQKYGEATNGSFAKINFGLMTGSYGNNKSGGVLRKTIGNMNNEINATTNGTFTGTSGVITNLDNMRIYGYRHDNGTYHQGGGADDNCSWGLNSFSNGDCSNWGNPQAEIYLESLRYLTGQSVNNSFNVNDAGRVTGFTSSSWGSAPVNNTNYCAPLSVIQFNASTTSYDGDDLASASDITGSTATLDSWTNSIANNTHENLSGDYFIGANGSDNNELCTPKSITNLSDVRGTCPDAPRLEGSYQISGLAYYARQNDLMPLSGSQTVRTYGVALAPALPKATIDVPGGSGQTVTIIPACRNDSVNGNCAIVEFKVVSQTSTAMTNSGTLYVNWEDSEQGGDFDQDLWGTINYTVTSSDVTVETDVHAQSTPNRMGFGYIVSGTTDDGFKVHSGINGFNGDGCSNCTTGDAATSQTYNIGTSGSTFLESPLYYAAKWGGYSDELIEELITEVGPGFTPTQLQTKIRDRDISDTYYFVTDPRKLEESLDKAFNSVAAEIGSASAVATNSTRLTEGSYVYQAQFNSENWSGILNSFEFDQDGNLPTNPDHSTANTMPTDGTSRNIYTYDGTNRVDFNWAQLTPAQRLALRRAPETTDTNAIRRLDWLRGNATFEGATGGLRERGTGSDRNILGDIINSSPAYIGAQDYRYNRLPGVPGTLYRFYLDNKRLKDPRVVVGANDGMVHVFHADTLQEIFTYVPGVAFPKLADITSPDYGRNSNPHQYIVDGPISVSDVYINNAWRTIVVGTLGAGGRGIYALDVTDTVPQVLFEIDENDFPQLGYVMGRPIIMPMDDGRWSVIFGNGDSSGTTSQLFVVDIEDPFNLSRTSIIDTSFGTGLSAPAILPDAKGQAYYAYAGDLTGRFWRFDLRRTVPADPPLLTFRARRSGVNQPITGAPTLGLNEQKPGGAIMAYFGTGKYYDAGDNIAAGSPLYSFYAIADIDATVDFNDLQEKTFTTIELTPFSASTRVVNEVNPNWGSQHGWYLDFNDTAGERVTTKPILLADKLIFPTLIPSTAACEFGGRSWIMQVTAVGDKFTGQTVIPQLIPQEFLMLGDLGFGLTGPGTGALIGSGTDATLVNEDATPPAETTGRQSWRELR